MVVGRVPPVTLSLSGKVCTFSCGVGWSGGQVVRWFWDCVVVAGRADGQVVRLSGWYGVCVCATAVGLAARSGEKCTGVMGSAQITSQCVKGIGPDQIRSDPLCVAERCAATLLVPHRTLPLRSSRNSCFHQGVSRLRQNQERSDPRKVTKSTT